MSEMSKPRLRCPACKKATFKMQDVWYPDQPDSKLKCPSCGQWNVLQVWHEATKQAWMDMAASLGFSKSVRAERDELVAMLRDVVRSCYEAEMDPGPGWLNEARELLEKYEE